MSEPESSRRFVEIEAAIGFKALRLRRDGGGLVWIRGPAANKPAVAQRAFCLRVRDDVLHLPFNRNRERG